MKGKLSIRDLALRGKRALIRVDFNVPLEQGKITDDTRIVASLPTINYVLDQGGAVVLMSHLGRPEGKRQEEFSLKPCADRLSKLLNRPVKMASDCVGADVERDASDLRPGEILLLENLRFHKAEEKPELDPTFAKRLATLGDLYINDAFGAAHRAHSSIVPITAYFPHKAAAGLLMEREMTFIGKALVHPKHPFYAIVGGVKISTKLGILKTLLEKVDGLFIGGAMAFTFLKVQGISIGDSICDQEYLAAAKEILTLCNKRGIPIWLPDDIVITKKLTDDAKPEQTILTKDGIPEGCMGVDIGPLTIKRFHDVLKHAATVLWNGPLGAFEKRPFAKGTFAIAKILSELKCTTLVGGGDSIAALKACELESKMTHVSTGGGASLELIEFGTLPGMEALSDQSPVKHQIIAEG